MQFDAKIPLHTNIQFEMVVFIVAQIDYGQELAQIGI